MLLPRTEDAPKLRTTTVAQREFLKLWAQAMSVHNRGIKVRGEIVIKTL